MLVPRCKINKMKINYNVKLEDEEDFSYIKNITRCLKLAESKSLFQLVVKIGIVTTNNITNVINPY